MPTKLLSDSNTGLLQVADGKRSLLRVQSGRVRQVLLAVGFTIAPHSLHAQLSSSATEKVPAHLFGSVSSIRELHDGRVLIADFKDRTLYIADWTTQRLTKIGSVGDRPGQYRGVGFLFALSRDSTLLTDPYARNWYLISGQRIAAVIPGNTLLPSSLGAVLAGADTSGNILGVSGYRAITRTKVSREAADSLHVLAAARGATRLDSLFSLRGMKSSTVAQRGGTIGSSTPNPLSAEDQALLFSDGWIAVAYVQPYRVDWRSPDGAWRKGRNLPFDRIEVDNRRKCQALGQTRDFCNHRGVTDWPAFVPPFLSPIRPRPQGGPLMTLFQTPERELLIWRTGISTEAQTYDLVDRNGELRRTLTLPMSELVVGFGARHIYIVCVDSAGKQYLRRREWIR